MDFELPAVSILERNDFGITAEAAQGVSVERGVVIVAGVWSTLGCLGVMSFVVVAESAVVVLTRLRLCSLLLLSLKTTAAASSHVGTRRRAIICNAWRASAGLKKMLFSCIKKWETSSTVPWWMI